MAASKNDYYHIGLNDQQVIESREKNGVNLLTPPKRPSLWKLYLEKFEDPIVRVLIVAAMFSLLISIIENEYAETIGIFFAIFLATGIGFYFEYDAGKKFDLLNAVNEETAVKVLRNGKVHEIPRKDVVAGDIIMLETGEEIPADGELIEAISMQVNESNLTGEPIIEKTTDESRFDEEATYASNMVMRGTTVVDGHGIMKVLRVGDATEIGKVAKQSTEKSEEPTPLNIQLTKLAQFIGTIGFSVALATFLVFFIKDALFISSVEYQGTLYDNLIGPKIISIAAIVGLMIAAIKMWMPHKFSYSINKKPSWFWSLTGIVSTVLIAVIAFMAYGLNSTETDNWQAYIALFQIVLKYFMMAVTLIVVAVPEGLPMSVSLSLALNMRRMLSTNNLVRKMHACETMGAVTVICTDKTGTLTQNLMQVHETKFYGLKESGKLADDEISNLIKEGISANSTAFLENGEAGSKPKGVGNPTEVALLLWLNSQDVNYLELREDAKVYDQLTFVNRKKVYGYFSAIFTS